jgi:pyridoxamine 5'-phosphate oxidase
VDPVVGELRRQHQAAGLDVADVDPDPIAQIRAWRDIVREHDDEPDAIVLATADGAGRPSARTVLLKGLDDRGLIVFTNYDSRKGREVAANPQATLLFSWPAHGRQVAATGPVERLPAEESDAYFATRPRGSQLGAWASPQSEVVADRAVLEERYVALESEYEGRKIPRPPHWGGLLLRPDVIELWQGRPNRLHDRLRYTRRDGQWIIDRLAP